MTVEVPNNSKPNMSNKTKVDAKRSLINTLSPKTTLSPCL